MKGEATRFCEKKMLSNWILCCVGQSLSFVYSFSQNGFSFPSVFVCAKIVEDGRYVIIWSLRIQTTAQSISKWIFTNNFRLVFDKVVSTKVLYKCPDPKKLLYFKISFFPIPLNHVREFLKSAHRFYLAYVYEDKTDFWAVLSSCIAATQYYIQ